MFRDRKTTMLELLNDFSEISDARYNLRRDGLSQCRPSFINRIAAKNWIPIEPRGHYMKSWDVWRTTEFIKNQFGNFSSEFSCLDMGAYGSEVPHILLAKGNKKVNVVDYNSSISSKAHGFEKCQGIFVGNMYDSSLYKGRRFDLVTSISVFEHGYDPEKIVGTMKNLLKDNGYLVMSIDYNYEKIDTSSKKLFGMSWNIFSYVDVLDLVLRLAEENIRLVNGATNIEELLRGNKRPIYWAEQKYTFLVLYFKKCL